MSVPAKVRPGNVPAPRHERIGSGDIAAILGLPDAFGSPYSVWVAKTTGVEPEPDERTLARWWWGEHMEPVILRRYGLLSPGHRQVDDGYQRHFIHSDYPFLTATTDGLFEDEEGVYIVEAKLSNFDLNDGVPYRVQAQAQWQMGISKIRRAVAAVLFVSDISRDLQIWDLEFDPDVFQIILDRALRFWFDNCVRRIPPEVDGHKATTAALRRIKGVDRVADISHLADIVEQLGKVKVAKKSIEQSETELTNKLKFELDSASVGQIGGKDAVTWRTSKSGSRTFLIKKAFLPKGSDDE